MVLSGVRVCTNNFCAVAYWHFAMLARGSKGKASRNKECSRFQVWEHLSIRRSRLRPTPVMFPSLLNPPSSFMADRSLPEEVVVDWMLPIAASIPTGHCSRAGGYHSKPSCRLGRGYSHQPWASDSHPRRLLNGENPKGRMAHSLPCEWAWTKFR